jgi:hypothetical protein
MSERTMTVRVKLPPAAAKAAGSPPGDAIEVQLGEGATAGDLLRVLSDRLGAPLSPTLHGGSGGGAHGSLRMFINGQLALDDSDPLAPPGEEVPQVIVAFVHPIQGGATNEQLPAREKPQASAGRR